MTRLQDEDGWVLPDDPQDASIRMAADGLCEMRFERFVPRPPQKVWAALTTPERIADWLGPPVDIDLRPGGMFLFRFNGGVDDLCGGRIRIYDPPRVLAFELNGAGGETLITWTLAPHDGGCRLTFTQAGLTPYWFFGGMGGWHGMVDDVVQLAMDEPMATFDPYWERVRRYESIFGPYAPGWDVSPPGARHHEPPALITRPGDSRYDVRFTRRYLLPRPALWEALRAPAGLAPTNATVLHDRLSWNTDGRQITCDLLQENAMIGVRLVLIEAGVSADRVIDTATDWHLRLHAFPDVASGGPPSARPLDRDAIANGYRVALEGL